MGGCSSSKQAVESNGATSRGGDGNLANGQLAVVTGSLGSVTLQSVYEQLSQNVAIKDRSWLGATYKACANAPEMVDWLEKQPYCGSRAQAVKLCVDLQDQDAIVHVWGSKRLKFQDQTMFFRFSGADAAVADQYDLVVIGGGTAGISATSFAGQFGANCVMIESNRVGGDCTWSGCVPSKSLIKASHDVHAAKEAHQFGIGISQPLADMKKVKEYVWDKINKVAAHDLHLLQDNNVPLRYGKAMFIDPNTLELKTKEGEIQQIKSRAFILCLGAVPAPPPIKGLDNVPYLTYESVFDVDVLPKRMCVVGGGVIGCELAQCFARFGSDVTLVANQLLPKEPTKVDEFLTQQFQADGITLLRGRADSVAKLDSSGSELRLTVALKGGKKVDVQCNVLLVATGRRPNTSEMNLAAAGVKLDEKTKLISVTPQLQTTAPHIYAAGDCCTLQQFTHYASIMGVWAARNLLLPGSTVPTHVVPRATFTAPEVASVGLTEAEAREKGYEIFSQPCSQNERAICENDQRGFIDVYLDKGGLVVGACIMNNRAGELLAELLVLMENKRPFTSLSLGKVLHPYPTYTWATMILATDVQSQKLHASTTGKAIKWIVGRR